MIISPSVNDLKQLVRNKAGTLNEIRQATVEKLTNKIVRSFCFDLALYSPFLFIVLLQYRAAALTEPTSGCYGEIANWLLVYFCFMLGFAFVKLFRLAIVRSLHHKWYFYYVMITMVLQFLTVTVWFVKGNFAIFRSVNQDGCDVLVPSSSRETEKLVFNAVPMQVLMSLVLIFHWFIVFLFIEFIIFTLLLWSLWSAVVRAVQKMQTNFSVQNFIESVREAIGDGELQDSLMISTIQYLLNDEDFKCKKCN